MKSWARESFNEQNINQASSQSITVSPMCTDYMNRSLTRKGHIVPLVDNQRERETTLENQHYQLKAKRVPTCI